MTNPDKSNLVNYNHKIAMPYREFLSAKFGWQNFDDPTCIRQNSSDFSTLEVLRYTVSPQLKLYMYIFKMSSTRYVLGLSFLELAHAWVVHGSDTYYL